jgi:hypothetical protein
VLTYHLVSEHEDSFEGKLALAVVEKVFEGGAQQVNHHNVVITLHAEPVHIWNSD